MLYGLDLRILQTCLILILCCISFIFPDVFAASDATQGLSLYSALGYPSPLDIQHQQTPSGWFEVTSAAIAWGSNTSITSILQDNLNGTVSVHLYKPRATERTNTTVAKRLWQSSNDAAGAVWVAALYDSLYGTFDYQDHPEWSAYCALQTALAIQGGGGIVSFCGNTEALEVYTKKINPLIAITSQDVEHHNNGLNNTLAFLTLGDPFNSVPYTISYLGFNSSAKRMVYSTLSVSDWLAQCNELVYPG